MDVLKTFMEDVRSEVLVTDQPVTALVGRLAELFDRFLTLAPIQAVGWAEPGDFHGKLLFEDPQTGFIAVLMTWGPGASTPVHDHGTWGVFGVCEESLEFTNYVLVDEGAVRSLGRKLARPGDVSYVIPPSQEIHQIHNPNPRIARSLHLYGRNIGF